MAAAAEEEEGSATVTGDEGACQLPRALGHGRAGLREAKEKTLKKRLDSGGKLEKKLFFFELIIAAPCYIYIASIPFCISGWQGCRSRRLSFIFFGSTIGGLPAAFVVGLCIASDN